MTWHPKQTSKGPPTGTLFVGGGWGAGKTGAGASRFILEVMSHPWTPAYGKKKHPTSIIAAPTNKILTQATLEEFFDRLPPEALLYYRRGSEPEIMLSNGHRVIPYSGKGDLEGVTGICCWIDEVHHRAFSVNHRVFLNLRARLRDKRAKRLLMIATGLPESGWTRDTFDKSTPAHKQILAGTKDNPHIPESLLQEFYESCPSGYEKMYLAGQWMAPATAVYPQFDRGVHLVDMEPDPRAPVHLGIDAGDFGAVVAAVKIRVKVKDVMGYEREEDGLLFFDELLSSNQSVDGQCTLIKTQKNWNITSESTICIDPKIGRDAHQAARAHFPNVRIVRRKQGHHLYPVEAGIRIVQLGLMDVIGNARILFSKKLKGTKHGLIESIESYRRSEKSGAPIKDNIRDHQVDSFRYICCEHIRQRKAETVTYRG